MNELEFSRIKDLVREGNDALFEKIQDWTNEHMVSREGYLKDQLHWNQNIIQPLKTKLNALWLSLGMIGGVAGILFFFFAER